MRPGPRGALLQLRLPRDALTRWTARAGRHGAGGSGECQECDLIAHSTLIIFTEVSRGVGSSRRRRALTYYLVCQMAQETESPCVVSVQVHFQLNIPQCLLTSGHPKPLPPSADLGGPYLSQQASGVSSSREFSTWLPRALGAQAQRRGPRTATHKCTSNVRKDGDEQHHR